MFERRHVLGGAAVTEEIVPGFKFSRASYLLSLLRPAVFKDLELKVKISLFLAENIFVFFRNMGSSFMSVILIHSLPSLTVIRVYCWVEIMRRIGKKLQSFQ